MKFSETYLDKVLILCIVASLFMQLKYFSRTYEPYPAILMPAGGKFVKSSDQIDFSEYKYFVYRSDSSKKEVESDDFLYSIPSGYHFYIASNYFGLPINEAEERVADTEKIKNGTEWLKERLLKITQFEDIHAFEITTTSSRLFFNNNQLDSTVERYSRRMIKVNF